MSDRPIIFSAPMVVALLANRKTQTRRVLKPQPYPFVTDGCSYWNASGCVGGRICISDADLLRLHRWKVNDRLYVREAWAHDGPDLEAVRSRHEDALGGGIGYGPYYRATETAPQTLSWRSPIHMPRWASRLTLVVTEVRVERLQDISEADCLAEGIQPHASDAERNGGGVRMWAWPGASGIGFHTPRGAYDALWTSIHGPRSWAANPWVCAISFETHRANIDSLPTDPTASHPQGSGQ